MTLPSGRVVTVRRAGSPEAEPLADDVVEGREIFAGRALRALSGERLVVDGLGDDGVLGLTLRDYHALRELAVRVGSIADEVAEYPCRNCDATIRVDPADADVDEILRRYEGDPAPERDWSLGQTVRLPRRRKTRTIRIEPVTVKDALPLWAALAGEGAWTITPEIVRGMGVRSIGDERNPKLLARVLARLPDEVWANVEEAFLGVQYSDRAFLPWACPACGALHEIDAPALREMDGMQRDGGGGEPDRFPTAEDFERMVERIAPEVYAERAVRNLAIRVEPGVPAVDDGGEPLLGSYEPRTGGAPEELEFLITLYYRSFQKMWTEEGTYDVEAEIRETIDHEVEHHLYYLQGYDPKDAEEREEIRRDLVKTFGAPTVRRYVAAGLVAEVWRFARFAWPFLLALAIFFAIYAILES